jgi:hypothetical protein
MRTVAAAAVFGMILSCSIAFAQSGAFKDSLKVQTPGMNAAVPNVTAVDNPRSAFKSSLTVEQEGVKTVAPDKQLKGTFKIEPAKN